MTDDTTYAFTLMLTSFLAGHARVPRWLAGGVETGKPAATGDDWARPRCSRPRPHCLPYPCLPSYRSRLAGCRSPKG